MMNEPPPRGRRRRQRRWSLPLLAACLCCLWTGADGGIGRAGAALRNETDYDYSHIQSHVEIEKVLYPRFRQDPAGFNAICRGPDDAGSLARWRSRVFAEALHTTDPFDVVSLLQCILHVCASSLDQAVACDLDGKTGTRVRIHYAHMLKQLNFLHEAVLILSDSRALLQEDFDAAYKAEVHSMLASCHTASGTYSMARKQYEEALALGVPSGQMNTMRMMGILLVASGADRQGFDYLWRVVELWESNAAAITPPLRSWLDVWLPESLPRGAWVGYAEKVLRYFGLAPDEQRRDSAQERGWVAELYGAPPVDVTEGDMRQWFVEGFALPQLDGRAGKALRSSRTFAALAAFLKGRSSLDPEIRVMLSDALFRRGHIWSSRKLLRSSLAPWNQHTYSMRDALETPLVPASERELERALDAFPFSVDDLVSTMRLGSVCGSDLAASFNSFQSMFILGRVGHPALAPLSTVANLATAAGPPPEDVFSRLADLHLHVCPWLASLPYTLPPPAEHSDVALPPPAAVGPRKIAIIAAHIREHAVGRYLVSMLQQVDAFREAKERGLELYIASWPNAVDKVTKSVLDVINQREGVEILTLSVGNPTVSVQRLRELDLDAAIFMDVQADKLAYQLAFHRVARAQLLLQGVISGLASPRITTFDYVVYPEAAFTGTCIGCLGVDATLAVTGDIADADPFGGWSSEEDDDEAAAAVVPLTMAGTFEDGRQPQMVLIRGPGLFTAPGQLYGESAEAPRNIRSKLFLPEAAPLVLLPWPVAFLNPQMDAFLAAVLNAHPDAQIAVSCLRTNAENSALEKEGTDAALAADPFRGDMFQKAMPTGWATVLRKRLYKRFRANFHRFKLLPPLAYADHQALLESADAVVDAYGRGSGAGSVMQALYYGTPVLTDLGTTPAGSRVLAGAYHSIAERLITGLRIANAEDAASASSSSLPAIQLGRFAVQVTDVDDLRALREAWSLVLPKRLQRADGFRMLERARWASGDWGACADDDFTLFAVEVAETLHVLSHLQLANLRGGALRFFECCVAHEPDAYVELASRMVREAGGEPMPQLRPGKRAPRSSPLPPHQGGEAGVCLPRVLRPPLEGASLPLDPGTSRLWRRWVLAHWAKLLYPNAKAGEAGPFLDAFGSTASAFANDLEEFLNAAAAGP